MEISENEIKTILLVEDEMILAMMGAKTIKTFGYNVITANTGETAVEIALNHKNINLILMDIDLGAGIDGPEAARLILEKKDIPIVFQTSHMEEEFVDRVKKITRYGYVIKNSGNFVLKSSIDMAFELFDTHQRLEKELKERLLVEETLRERDDRFRKLFEISTIGIAITSPEKGWIDVNDRISEMLGYSKEELKNLTWAELTYHEDLSLDVAQFERILAGEIDNYSMDKRFVRKNGSIIWTTLGVGCVRNPDRSVNYLIALLNDITERKHAEELIQIKNEELSAANEEMSAAIEEMENINEELKLSEEKFTKAFIASPDMISITTASNGTYLDVNDNFLLKSGYTRNEVINHTSQELNAWLDLSDRNKFLELLLKNGRVSDFESKFRLKNGNIVVYSISSETIEINNERCYLHYTRDITDQKRAEEIQKESNEKILNLANKIPAFIAYVNAETLRYEFVNEKYVKSFEISRDRIIGSHIKEVIGESNYQFALKYIEEVKRGIPCSYENTFNLDIGKRYIKVNFIPDFDAEGKVKSIITLSYDITELKEFEEKNNALLSEKELILKEVHHRIKNNMLTIYSLLEIQADSLNEPAAISALKDASNRVKSMQLLYDKLYLSSNFSNMPMKEYLPTLVEQIVYNFPYHERVRIEKEIEDFELDSRKTFTLGILINEILTNIMKYAFKERNEGLIFISATLKENRVCIIIKDNGSGMPETVSFENSPSFGLMLVGMLTNQLGGTIRLERDNGTKIVLHFDK